MRNAVLLIALIVFFLMNTTESWAQQREAAANSYLASGKVGTSSHLAGLALEAITKLGLSGDADLHVSLRSTSGLPENLRLLQAREVDFAVSDGVLSHLAHIGKEPFAGQPQAELRAVAALWREVEHFVVRDDQVRSGTIVDLQQVSPRRILQFDPDGSGLHSLMYLFSRIGSGVGAPFKLALVEEPGLAAQVLDSKEAGSLHLKASAPSPFAAETWDTATEKLRLLEFTGQQIEKITGGVPVWTSHVIPPGSYPGQDYPIYTTARATLLVTRADVPDIAVYQIAKALHGNSELLRNVSPEAPLSRALAGLPVPLHPGALRYYREAGKLPDDLLTVPSPVELARIERSFEPKVAAAGGHGQGHAPAKDDHAAQGAGHAQHASHGGDQPAHVHDEAMLSRARAEVHDGKEVLKIGRPEQLGADVEIFKIYFGLGQSGLDPEGQRTADAAARFITEMFGLLGKEPEVYVEGHTDRTGDWRTNFDLAHKRASAVRDSLIASGIRKDWIHISDYSEDRILVPTADGVGERRNRRVEITVIPPKELSDAGPRPETPEPTTTKSWLAEQGSGGAEEPVTDTPPRQAQTESFENFLDWVKSQTE